MKFIVLKIDTGYQEFEFKYQLELFKLWIASGEVFKCTGDNREVIDYLKKNANNICNNSDASIAINWDSKYFQVILTQENPEFSYKGMSVSIIDYNLKEIPLEIKKEEDPLYPVDSKWNHIKYGKGHIVKDREEMCKDDEVMFYADDSFPFPNTDPNAKYTGWTNLTKINIVNKSDLEKR